MEKGRIIALILAVAALLAVVYAGFGSSLLPKKSAPVLEENVPTQTLKLYPAGDAYVLPETESATHGTEPVLIFGRIVSGKEVILHLVYLKFDLGQLPDLKIVEAKLKIYGKDPQGYPLGQLCNIADQNWNENKIVWENRPSFVASLIFYERNLVEGWNEFDVTSYVEESLAGIRYLSFGFWPPTTTDTYLIIFASEEADDFQPYLEITYYE